MSSKASDEVRSRDTSPEAQAFLDRLFLEKSERWRSDRFFSVNHFARGGGDVDEADNFLRALLSILNGRALPYMIVGSTASSWVGDARMTQDVDVVVDPTSAEQMMAVARDATAARWYADELTAREAFEHRGMVNLIHPESGWKADLIVRADNDYDRTAFARRFWHGTRVGPCPIPTVEDQVLSKLRWAQMGGSERQRRDCAGILRKWLPRMDRSYLTGWADHLGVRAELDELVREIEA